MTTDIERGGIELSQPHEPSYYEIALTNRQVVVAFVILLVCVVAAFLSGVWIGRESAVRAQDRMALLAQRAASDTAADKEKVAGQPLQELQFFADPRHRPAAGAPAPDGTMPTNTAAGHGAARDDASAGAADAGAPPDAGPQAPPAPSKWTSQAGSPASTASGANGSAGSKGRPAAAARAATAAPDEPSGEGEAPGDTSSAGGAGSVVRPRPLPDGPGPATAGAKSASAAARRDGSAASAARQDRSSSDAARQDKSASAAVKPSEAAAAPDAGGASGAAASSGDMVIQVFSSADREQADRVRAGLVDAGFQAFLSPLAKNGQTMYRVRIGPFASRAAAEPVAEKVRKEQKLDTWITPK